MTDLSQLLEKVRTAEAGSRELDAEIEVQARRFRAYAVGLTDETRAKWIAVNDGIVCDPHTSYSAPHLTTSLDAIVALIERELSGENDGPLLYARAGYWNDSAEDGRPYLQTFSIATSAPTVLTDFEESGATEPLALCAALLSALISKEKADG